MIVLVIALGFPVVGLIFPLFLARSRQARGRLAGMLGGAYLAAASALGIGYTGYVALAYGGVGIGRRTLTAVILFADQPILASLVLLINIAGLGCLAALGGHIYRDAREG